MVKVTLVKKVQQKDKEKREIESLSSGQLGGKMSILPCASLQQVVYPQYISHSNYLVFIRT